jgi:hypothetical protein
MSPPASHDGYAKFDRIPSDPEHPFFDRDPHQAEDDYEACGDCGFDHSYEYAEAKQWHLEHPCSYCNYNQKDGHEPTCPTGLGDVSVPNQG